MICPPTIVEEHDREVRHRASLAVDHLAFRGIVGPEPGRKGVDRSVAERGRNPGIGRETKLDPVVAAVEAKRARHDPGDRGRPSKVVAVVRAGDVRSG